jgi:hypothetical protein
MLSLNHHTCTDGQVIGLKPKKITPGIASMAHNPIEAANYLRFERKRSSSYPHLPPLSLYSSLYSSLYFLLRLWNIHFETK